MPNFLKKLILTLDYTVRIVPITFVLMLRDLKNYRFGIRAPKYAELIWIDPKAVQNVVSFDKNKLIRQWVSASIIDFETLVTRQESFHETRQYQACQERFVLEKEWSDTLDYRDNLQQISVRGKCAGCRNKAELDQRYLVIDQIFISASKSRKLLTQKQLKPLSLREYNGIMISIDKDQCLFLTSGEGFHRLAIAQLLNLPFIPAQLGAVDYRAIKMVEALRLRTH